MSSENDPYEVLKRANEVLLAARIQELEAELERLAKENFVLARAALKTGELKALPENEPIGVI